MSAALRHLATQHDAPTAVLVALISWNVGMAVDTTTDSTGLGLLANLGTAGLIVVAILFMLRRSDNREAKDRQAIEHADSALVAELRDQVATLKHELDAARNRPSNIRTRKDDPR